MKLSGRKRRRRARVYRAALCSVVAAALLLLSGCGEFFYTSDIAGYVKDDDSTEGIDGALIRVYLTEPSAATADGYVVETATMTSQGNPGYFSHRIIWRESAPDFGEEGDSGTIWIGVSHEDYFPKVAQVSGVLSDTLNVVPDIKLARITFSSSEVSGRVVDERGNGVNGVRVVLDLPATEDIDEDYVVQTATDPDDQTIGAFTFEDIEWEDAAAVSTAESSVDVLIYIDSPDYYCSYNKDSPLTVAITSGQENAVLDTISVKKATFSVPYVKGSVSLSAAGENGVRVVLDLLSTDVAEDYVTTTHNDGTTDGVFQFTDVEWRDSSPSPADADLERVRIYVADDEYNADYDAEEPMVVDLTKDTAKDLSTAIAVTKTGYLCPKLRGKVVDGNGDGVNGVRVTVDLVSTPDVNPDFETTTGPIDGAAGYYELRTIEWRDEAPETPEVEDVVIAVSDPDWTATSTKKQIQAATELDISGTAPFTVTRLVLWEFSATVTGKCYYDVAGREPPRTPIPGVTVTVSDAGTNTGLEIFKADESVQTDEDGVFTVEVSWTRASTYNPYKTHPTLADGEDVLQVDVAYSSNTAGTTNLYSFTDLAAYEIRGGKTNTVPDAVDTDPGT